MVRLFTKDVIALPSVSGAGKLPFRMGSCITLSITYLWLYSDHAAFLTCVSSGSVSCPRDDLGKRQRVSTLPEVAVPKVCQASLGAFGNLYHRDLPII